MKSHNLFVPLLATVLLSLVSATSLAQTSSLADGTEKQQGIDLYRKGKIAEAEAILCKIVKQNPADSEAWYYLGLVLLEKPDLGKAARSFETSLELNPQFAPAHVGLGYAHLGRNKLNLAILEASTALNLDPLLPDAHYIIGASSLSSGSLTEALARANQALKLDDGLAKAHLLKSMTLVALADKMSPSREKLLSDDQLRSFEEAAAALETFLRLRGNGPSDKKWADQLETLRFYIASTHQEKGDDGIFRAQGLATRPRVFRKPEPSYTESARQNQIQGTVILNVVFGADGSVKHILIVKDVPMGLTERCLEVALQIQFEPAVVDGRPVSVLTRLEYNFNVF